MVFDRMDCYWGGAPTEPTDFSNYAMGSRSRMLNFLPTNPYGLIASVPANTELSEHHRFRANAGHRWRVLLRRAGPSGFGS